VSRPKISRAAARAVLAELQLIADKRGAEGKAFSDGDHARVVLASLIGTLEGHLPSAEWNKVDCYRVKRAS
jgi:hypothetical protein